MNLEPRDIQTQVKHRILEKYLKSWGGIILNGLKARARRTPGRRLRHSFVYVDCFAHVGRYSGNWEDIHLGREGEPVPGSPLIGIQALDELVSMARGYGIDLRVNAILIEQNPDVFEGLLETLSVEGLMRRVRQTTDFFSLDAGDIAVVNDDSIQIVDKLLAYTERPYTKSFYLLDPYGPTGIPSDQVR